MTTCRCLNLTDIPPQLEKETDQAQAAVGKLNGRWRADQLLDKPDNCWGAGIQARCHD
jgi:hypothetical protein